MSSLSPHGSASVLRVDLGERSYQVHVGAGLLARAGDLIARATASSRVFIITNPIVDRLHGDNLRRGLIGASTETILVPAGERQKSLRRAALLYDRLLESGADRHSVIVAFGGGVIGDLAGFVAATYMRGVPYVQAPSTLLAQVDASVGGKVAVDHPRAKNLIGAFYQPCVVIADADVLQTLPAREYRSGMAEVIKHAAIADAELFEWLRLNANAVAAREPAAVAYMVQRNCEIKANVVRQDERESGMRAVLNFGHTVGHALEALGGYRAFRHGEAVAVGMVAAARVSVATGRLSSGEADEIERLLELYRLPRRIPGFSVAQILTAMRADKKAATGAPRFVLPLALGRAEFGAEAPEDAVARVLADLGAIP